MKCAPTTDLAKRVAALCKRKPTTPWADKEIRAYKHLVKSGFFNDLSDFALIESYYAFERKKGDKGFYRRDLYTFLFNAAGELDRATAWRELHPVKAAPRKIIPMPPVASEPFVPSADEVESMARFAAERELRKRQ